MLNLVKINTDAEALFTNHDVLYHSLESDNVFFKKYYATPSIELVFNDSYDDMTFIPLRAIKKGVNGDIVWSHNIGTNAKIEGNVLTIIKHYVGNLTITAKVGDIQASKTLEISCGKTPKSYTYQLVKVDTTPTVEWDATEATIGYSIKTTAKFDDGKHADESITNQLTQVVNFEMNPYKKPTINYHYVDLGLPSGLKWAKCNIGATSESDYGSYFAWGDTIAYKGAGITTIERKGTFDYNGVEINWTVKQKNEKIKTFDWTHTPFNNDSSSYDSTYFASVSSIVCPNDVLAAEYDGVHQLMGGNWKMPTYADFNELLQNTTNEWVTNYNDSGKNGRLFMSKTNDNTLFIPASGYAGGGSMNNVGSNFRVWSSSLGTSNPNLAWRLYASSSECNMNLDNRYYGFALRGVLST